MTRIGSADFSDIDLAARGMLVVIGLNILPCCGDCNSYYSWSWLQSREPFQRAFFFAINYNQRMDRIGIIDWLSSSDYWITVCRRKSYSRWESTLATGQPANCWIGATSAPNVKVIRFRPCEQDFCQCCWIWHQTLLCSLLNVIFTRCKENRVEKVTAEGQSRNDWN